MTFNNSSLVVCVYDNINPPWNRKCTTSAWMMKKVCDHTVTWLWIRNLSAVFPSPVIRSPHVKPLSIRLYSECECLVLRHICDLHPEDDQFLQLCVYNFKKQSTKGDIVLLGILLMHFMIHLVIHKVWHFYKCLSRTTKITNHSWLNLFDLFSLLEVVHKYTMHYITSFSFLFSM